MARSSTARVLVGFTAQEARDYLRCVQARTLRYDVFKVESALALLGEDLTAKKFREYMRFARRVERGRPGFVLCTPTGAGRDR